MSRMEILVVDGLRFLNLTATILDASKYCVASLVLDSQNSRSLASERNFGRGVGLLVGLVI